MRSPSIILSPIVSEKSFRLASLGQYTFVVDRRATAADVAHAIEALYGVDVVGVRTSNMTGKRTRYKGHAGQRVSWKKAMVAVKAGQRIEGFEVVTEEAKPEPAATAESTDATKGGVKTTVRTAAKKTTEQVTNPSDDSGQSPKEIA